MNTRDTWPPERDALAIRLRGEGLSASKIGLQLGVERGAVIGRLHRLKLRGVDVPAPKPVARKEKPPRRAYNRKVTVAEPDAIPKIKRGVWFGSADRDAIAIAPIGPGIPFLELKLRSCRYPLWGDYERQSFERRMFCGDPTSSGSYCDHHRAICTGSGTPSERRASDDREIMKRFAA